MIFRQKRKCVWELHAPVPVSPHNTVRLNCKQSRNHHSDAADRTGSIYIHPYVFKLLHLSVLSPETNAGSNPYPYKHGIKRYFLGPVSHHTFWQTHRPEQSDWRECHQSPTRNRPHWPITFVQTWWTCVLANHKEDVFGAGTSRQRCRYKGIFCLSCFLSSTLTRSLIKNKLIW